MGRARLPLLLGVLLLLPPALPGVQPKPGLDGGAESDLRRRREDAAAPRPPPAAPDAAAPLLRAAPRVAPVPAPRRRRRRQRSEPLLSIDLPFELLRGMLEASRKQSQEARAEENRRLMERVGK